MVAHTDFLFLSYCPPIKKMCIVTSDTIYFCADLSIELHYVGLVRFVVCGFSFQVYLLQILTMLLNKVCNLLKGIVNFSGEDLLSRSAKVRLF